MTVLHALCGVRLPRLAIGLHVHLSDYYFGQFGSCDRSRVDHIAAIMQRRQLLSSQLSNSFIPRTVVHGLGLTHLDGNFNDEVSHGPIPPTCFFLTWNLLRESEFPYLDMCLHVGWLLPWSGFVVCRAIHSSPKS